MPLPTGRNFCNIKNFIKAKLMALDGIFEPSTRHGTKTYQASKGLNPSGIVDSATYVQAVEDGFDSTINV
jgi:murein L,D-transpeptidase YcbB/YkuD